MTYYIGKEEIVAVSDVINANSLERYATPKSKVSEFEREFSEFCGTNYSLAVSSGTAALICCLKSLGIGHGDEVILPAHTYIATALAVLSVGAIPVIVNINDSLTIEPKEIRSNISNTTKAIIAVHMYGLPCYMQEILNITKEKGIFLIEDVAQACGGSYNGKRLGSFGDMGAFSFNHYKIISSGEGGAIITNNKDYYLNSVVEHHGGIFFEKECAAMVQNHSRIGSNYRLSEISGAILLSQLKRIETFISGLRSEKRFLTDEISEFTNDKYRIPPISDKQGDCSRGFFLRFSDSNLANKFLSLTQSQGIDSFLTFSRGHTASCWQHLLGTVKIFKKSDKDTFFQENFIFNPETFTITDKILKTTVGINTKHDRSKVELNALAKSVRSIVEGL